jgi:hypothetical protein
MLPNIRVEQYEIKNQGTFDGAKWLTKYDVKIQFSDRDIAYAMKDRIDKFLQGEDYRAMYLKVRDELAELQQRTWVGLTDAEVESYWDWEDFQTGAGRSTIFEMVRDIEAKLKEKNT